MEDREVRFHIVQQLLHERPDYTDDGLLETADKIVRYILDGRASAEDERE